MLHQQTTINYLPLTASEVGDTAELPFQSCDDIDNMMWPTFHVPSVATNVADTAELVNMILQEVYKGQRVGTNYFRDLLALSGVSRLFHGILKPYLFHHGAIGSKRQLLRLLDLESTKHYKKWQVLIWNGRLSCWGGIKEWWYDPEIQQALANLDFSNIREIEVCGAVDRGVNLLIQTLGDMPNVQRIDCTQSKMEPILQLTMLWHFEISKPQPSIDMTSQVMFPGWSTRGFTDGPSYGGTPREWRAKPQEITIVASHLKSFKRGRPGRTLWLEEVTQATIVIARPSDVEETKDALRRMVSLKKLTIELCCNCRYPIFEPPDGLEVLEISVYWRSLYTHEPEQHAWLFTLLRYPDKWTALKTLRFLAVPTQNNLIPSISHLSDSPEWGDVRYYLGERTEIFRQRFPALVKIEVVVLRNVTKYVDWPEEQSCDSANVLHSDEIARRRRDLKAAIFNALKWHEDVDISVVLE